MDFVKLLAGENGVPIIKILAVFFPVLLFLFKYILPWLAETVDNVPSGKRTKIKIELIQFPVDLMFVAIGYTIPQIIEIILDLSLINDITNDYNQLIVELLKNCLFAFLALLFIPFFVFGAKMAVNVFFSISKDKDSKDKNSKNKAKMITISALLYLFAVGSIWFSIFF